MEYKKIRIIVPVFIVIGVLLLILKILILYSNPIMQAHYDSLLDTYRFYYRYDIMTIMTFSMVETIFLFIVIPILYLSSFDLAIFLLCVCRAFGRGIQPAILNSASVWYSKEELKVQA